MPIRYICSFQLRRHLIDKMRAKKFKISYKQVGHMSRERPDIRIGRISDLKDNRSVGYNENVNVSCVN